MLGRGTHMSHDLAEILKIVDQRGLPYRLTPLGTCIEGQWDEIINLVKDCHARARIISPHVLTTIRIEDEERAAQKLSENVAAVERAVGHRLST
jgi:uncharacterized protein YqgV (UPF0045/DUF77 family)